MTLDEAIEHIEEAVDNHNKIKQIKAVTLEECIRVKEYKQLAEWLKELKAFRERSDLDEYSSRLWKNAYNRGWQDALSKAEDEAYDINIDGEMFRCIQVETLIGLGMSRETEPYRNHIR